MDDLIDALLVLWRELRRVADPKDPEAGVGAAQYLVLKRLRRRGPTPVGELAGHMGVTSSSMTTTCKRLERQGLVRRLRRSGDERVVDVALTDRGQETVGGWHRRRREAWADLLRTLTADDRADLLRLVERILDRGKEGGGDGDH